MFSFVDACSNVEQTQYYFVVLVLYNLKMTFDNFTKRWMMLYYTPVSIVLEYTEILMHQIELFMIN